MSGRWPRKQHQIELCSTLVTLSACGLPSAPTEFQCLINDMLILTIFVSPLTKPHAFSRSCPGPKVLSLVLKHQPYVKGQIRTLCVEKWPFQAISQDQRECLWIWTTSQQPLIHLHQGTTMVRIYQLLLAFHKSHQQHSSPFDCPVRQKNQEAAWGYLSRPFKENNSRNSLIPHPSKPFMVEVDTLETSIGAVLSQQLRRIAQTPPSGIFLQENYI